MISKSKTFEYKKKTQKYSSFYIRFSANVISSKTWVNNLNFIKVYFNQVTRFIASFSFALNIWIRIWVTIYYKPRVDCLPEVGSSLETKNWKKRLTGLSESRLLGPKNFPQFLISFGQCNCWKKLLKKWVENFLFQNFFCIRQKALLKHLKILDYFTHFKKFLYSALINIDIICQKIFLAHCWKKDIQKLVELFTFVVKTFD